LERTPDRHATEYDLIFDAISDAVLLLDLDQEGQVRFQRINKAAERWLGVGAETARGKTLRQLLAERAEPFEAPLEECLRSRLPVAVDLSVRPAKDSPAATWHISLVPVLVADQVSHVVASAHDITERKRMEEEIRRLSFHDKLTGLYNRRYFEQELIRLQGGRDYPVTVLCCDVDGLKLINDTLGHRAGDRVLRSFAGLLRKAFRKSDAVARVGGDEFAVALTRTPMNVAEQRCRWLESLIDRYNRRRPQMPLSASFGLATSEGREQSLAETFREADRIMYQHKVQRTAAAAHGIVRALVTALVQKDTSQETHNRCVAAISRSFGEALDLGRKDLANLMLLAEMHNLGTVGVPEKILHKRGRLTRGERELMQQHAMMGYRIARASPELTHIADLILHHHEWNNGEGYPMGLTGDEIPLPCRVIAIVDAYCAMTSDRPYRPAMSHERAMQELLFYAGTQFDPALVERFLSVMAQPDTTTTKTGDDDLG
jgi:diguanylate cyclase (GGDEF)-like protein/PAS domain S-box-containing protein